MTSAFAGRPQIVAVSGHSGFVHRIQSLVDTLGFATRITSDWRAAPDLIERIGPGLAVLDFVPGQEAECWLTLEAIKARTSTQTTPVLVCPVANWLLVGHEARLAQQHVHV